MRQQPGNQRSAGPQSDAQLAPCRQLVAPVAASRSVEAQCKTGSEQREQGVQQTSPGGSLSAFRGNAWVDQGARETCACIYLYSVLQHSLALEWLVKCMESVAVLPRHWLVKKGPCQAFFGLGTIPSLPPRMRCTCYILKPPRQPPRRTRSHRLSQPLCSATNDPPHTPTHTHPHPAPHITCNRCHPRALTCTMTPGSTATSCCSTKNSGCLASPGARTSSRSSPVTLQRWKQGGAGGVRGGLNFQVLRGGTGIPQLSLPSRPQQLGRSQSPTNTPKVQKRSSSSGSSSNVLVRQWVA